MKEGKTNSSIVIFGFGGLGKEIFSWIKCSKNTSLKVQAFVDDNPQTHGTYMDVPIVDRSFFNNHEEKPSFILAIATPKLKPKIRSELEQLGWKIKDYIHESLVIGLNVKIGSGVIICPRCSISPDVTIGENVLINGGCAIGHDSFIGNSVSLLGSVSVNGNVFVDDFALLGAGSIIHPGKRIEKNATVGMGSVVFKNVKTGQTVLGNPAKIFLKTE